MAIAYDEGKLIGLLTGTGGISDLVADILVACKKETGSQVVYDAAPRRASTGAWGRGPPLISGPEHGHGHQGGRGER